MPDPLDFETAADVVAQDNDRIASDAASIADPFAQAAGMVASEQKVLLATAVKVGNKANPDTRARAIALADQTRLPVDVVERNLDTVARKVRDSSVDLEQLAKHHPAVAEWLSDPNNAAISNDDLGGIRRVDAAIRALNGEDPSGILPPGYLFSAGKIIRPIGDGALADTWDTLDDLAKDLEAKGERDLVVGIQRKMNADAFDQEWGWAQHLMAGAGQSLQSTQRALGTRTEYDRAGDEVIEASHVNAPGWFGDVQRGIGGLIADVPLMMLGGPVAKGAVALAHLSRARAAVSTVVGRATATRLGKAGTVAASVQPLAIREGITETQDHGAVDGALAWMVETVVPGAFGRTGVERAILGSGGAPIADGWRGVLKRLITDAGLEAGEEAVTEFAHAVRENATGADPHALDPDNLWRRLSVAATVGGVAGGGFSLPGTIAEKFARDGEEAHRATSHADKLTNAIETLAASKTNARAGDRVLDLMEKSLGQSDRFSFVDAEDFRGAFDDPAAAAAALGMSKEYAEALATGGQLQIPTAKLLQRASTDESTAKLVPKVRRSPVSRNAAEAAKFVDGAPEEVKRLQSQARASAESVKAAGASPDAELQGMIEERLIAAGQEATTARTNAQVMSRTFIALGKRAGKDPAELYRTYLDGRITKVLPKLMRGEKFDLVDAMLERIRTGEVPSDKDINGPSLVDFLRDKGLRDLAFNGELVQLKESDGSRLPGERSLIRDDGITLDEAAELAAEAGYLQERDIPALLRALDDELRGGSPAYIEGNGDPNARAIRESLDQMERALRVAGVDVFSATNKQAREALAKMMEEQEGKSLGQGAAREPMSREQFRRHYMQHVDLRGRESGKSLENREAILRDGFDADGQNVNLLPIPAGAPTNIIEAKFAPKAGDVVYLVPKEGRIQRGNGSVTKKGWKPSAGEALIVTEDGPDIYALHLAATQSDGASKALNQGSAVTAPRDSRLDLEALLKQWRKATGDRTPIGGDAAFQALADESDAVDAANGKSYQQPAYHGTGNASPYDALRYDKVNASGGEGTQFEGWGIYVTGSEGVGKYYRKQNTSIVQQKTKTKAAPEAERAFIKENVDRLRDFVDAQAWSPKLKIEVFKELRREYVEGIIDPQYLKEYAATLPSSKSHLIDLYNKTDPEDLDVILHWMDDENKESLDFAIAMKSGIGHLLERGYEKEYRELYGIPGNGLLYKVELPDDDGTNYLDWNEVTGSQSEEIQERLDEAFRKNASVQAITWWEEEGHQMNGEEVYRKLESDLGSAKAASDALHDAGIVGNKYLGGQHDGNAGAPKRRPDYYNYVMFEDVSVRSYEQPKAKGKGPRGSLVFGKGRNFTIRLFQSENLSTFLHEGGHLFLEVMGDLATATGAAPDLVTDYQAMRDWFGKNAADIRSQAIDLATDNGAVADVLYKLRAASDADIAAIAEAFRTSPKDGTAAGYLHEAMHEYFARGFEAYLMEGKAPVPSLRSAFARIKGWMVAIYNTVKTLRVQLSPEIVDVFDRLVASEDEVDAAESRAGTSDILPPELFADPAAFDEYRLAVQANQSAARDRLARELIGDYRKELAIAWREQRDEIRADVAREVDGRPVFQIISALQRGQLPDGSRLPDEYQGIKLDKGELVTEWGEAVLKKLPGPANVSDNAANRGAFMYSDENGLPIEQVAKAWGFPDGTTMIEAMIAAPDRDSLIETTVAAKMRELHPDPLVDGSLVDRADRAIAGDLRGELLVREMRALGSRTGQTPAPIEVLRHVARETISQQKVRDLTPDKYRVAAATSARRATEAAGKQDWSTAYIEKQREALNLELYRAARDAKESGEKGRAYLRTFDTLSGRQRVGKAGGGEFVVYDERGEVLDAFRSVEDAQALVERGTGRSYTQTNGYMEQIDQILEGFSLRRPSNRSLRKRESLRKWIDRKQKEGEPVDIDPQIVDDLGNRNWNDLTVAEQGAAVDAVKNIAHIVQLKNRLMRDAKAKTFEEARGTIVDTIIRHQPVSRPDQITDDLPHRVGDAIKWYFDAHRKDSFLAHKMDGYQAGGTVWDYFIRPRNEAATEQETRNAKAAMEFSALFKEWGKNPGAIARSIPGTNLKLTLQERIGLALNWGNAEGRQRVLMYLNRHGKTANDAQAVLDSLDAADWTLVNGMVRQINSHWSDIAALERRVTGLAPEKVQAVPFVTKAGVQPGGYYPIKYNARKSNKAGDLQAVTEASQQAAAAGGRAQTRRGHTKIRADNVEGLALRLDFGVAGEHLAEVIHDLTHREMLIDQNKLLRDKSISLTIKDHHGRNALDQLVETAKDIAIGDKPGRAAAERLLRFLRINGSAATFGFNLTSALMNLTGFSQSLVRVGPGHMASAVARVTRDAAHLEASTSWVEEKSGFMKNRANTFLREVADAARRIEPGGGMANVRRWGYWPMTQVQRAVDTVTWIAAYDKALAEEQRVGNTLAMAEPRAIAIADQMVIDTQGSGRVGDLSAMQRGGEAAKLLTAFYSYFSVSANLQGAAIGRLWNDPKDPRNWLRLGTTTLLVWTLPAVMGGMIRSFLQGDDRDEDKRWEHLIREQAGFGAGMLVGIREASGGIEGGFGYSGPAGARGLGNLANLAGQAADLDADAGMVKAAISMGGTITGMPSTQANRLLDAVMQFEKDGDTMAALRRALFGAPRRE